MRTLCLLILFVALFYSCDTIYWENPQPLKVKQLAEYPDAFIGQYLTEDGDTVVIGCKYYSHPEEIQGKFHVSKIDSDPDLEMNNYILTDKNLNTDDPIRLFRQGDTLSYNQIVRLKKPLSETFLIKPFKKNILVISELEEGKDYWLVYLMEKTKTGLIVWQAGKENSKSDWDIENFKKYTEVTTLGKEKYLINPNHKELKKLIKKGFFEELMTLHRI